MLDQVMTGKKVLPPRIVLHGQEKIGKTTFAAQAPGAIFLPTEDGADEVGAARFPKLESFDDAIKALRALAKGEHDYRTAVIDSGDWLERLIHEKVCANLGVKSIEDIGYGKGYVAAIGLWQQVLAGLDYLRQTRGMATVVICHTEVKRFDSPEVEPYDRYTLKLHKSASALLTEWCDVVGFACQDTVIRSSDVGFNKEVRRAATSGKRLLRLQGAPAYVAGNRYGLPASVPLSWPDFVSAFPSTTTTKAEDKDKEQ
jgi:hypothetical protein